MSISMVEAFYNISDHAKAGENAFSLIKKQILLPQPLMQSPRKRAYQTIMFTV